MARDEAYTRQALEPFLADFYGAAVTGVRDSRSKYPDTSHIHRKTTRRSLARDHIVYELRGHMEGRERVRVWDRNQTTYFLVDGELELLVKKATGDGDVVLNQNRLALGFQANRQGDLFGYEKTNLYLSYADNDGDPENPSVLVICPDEGGHEWMFEIEPPAARIAAEISAPLLPDTGEELVRVIPIEKTEEDSE